MALAHYVASLKPTWAGRFFYYCLPIRKKIVLANIKRVFDQQLSQAQCIKLAKAFYSHMVTSLWENLKLRFTSKEALRSQVEVVGLEHLLEASQHNKGVAILTGHFGNWELAPIGGMLNFKAYHGRLHVIRKTLKAKWLEKILFRRYLKAGFKVIPKHRALSRACDALANNDAVIFIMDQHASIESKDGVYVDFFGQPAGTYRSLATIAQYTQVPVVPMACYRKASGQHVLTFYPALSWQDAKSPQEAVAFNTRCYNQVLERLVLERPEQWLWFHRRWK